MKHKLTYKPEDRLAWCSCGRWKGYPGTDPDAAVWKQLWLEHIPPEER